MEPSVRSQSLSLAPSEVSDGIVAATLITYKRSTIVVLETKEGFIATGTNAPWPGRKVDPTVSVARARQSAHYSLDRIREAQKAIRQSAKCEAAA